MDATVPPPLKRVLDFVNTLDVEAGTDDIDTPAKLKGWLYERGLMTGVGRVTGVDVAMTAEVRDAIRGALLANGGHPRAQAPAPLAAVPLRLAVGPDGNPILEPAGHGVAAALGALVAAIPGAVADGTWVRAKLCIKDTCRWAFYDQSRNRSRRWCTMDVCGNREKTRAFRERQGAGQD